MAQTAAGAVFGTYELLEHILLQLPLSDLFADQRVSQTWQAVTMKSIPLRKKMFLHPYEAPLVPIFERHLLKELYVLVPGYAAQMMLNPILSKIIHPRTDTYKVAHEAVRDELTLAKCRVVQHYRLDELHISIRPHKCIDKQGSWRQTFITQPPITEVLFFGGASGGQLTEKLLCAPEGLTWEFVFQEIWQEVQQIRERNIGQADDERLLVISLMLQPPVKAYPHLHKALETCDKQHGEDGLCKCLRAFSGI